MNLGKQTRPTPHIVFHTFQKFLERTVETFVSKVRNDTPRHVKIIVHYLAISFMFHFFENGYPT